MAHGSADRANGAFQLLLNCNSPQEQITIMNLTDAGLLTSTEHSCHPNHGLTLLSSSRDPFRFFIPRFYLYKTSSITSTKVGNTCYGEESGWRMSRGA